MDLESIGLTTAETTNIKDVNVLLFLDLFNIDYLLQNPFHFY